MRDEGGQTHRDEPAGFDPSAGEEPYLVEEVPGRLGGLRTRVRTHRAFGPAYRVGVAILGTAVIALGVILLPFPGPGWVTIFVGLGILATEFAWAERLLHFAKVKVLAWTHWVARQPLVVKALLGLACIALIAAVVAGYLAWRGVPEWLPFLD